MTSKRRILYVTKVLWENAAFDGNENLSEPLFPVCSDLFTHFAWWFFLSLGLFAFYFHVWNCFGSRASRYFVKSDIEIALSKLWHQRISRLKTGETEAQKYLQHYWPAYPLHFHHACRMEYKMDLFFLNFALAIVWHQFWPDFAEVVGGKTCHHFTVAIFQKKNCCWP